MTAKPEASVGREAREAAETHFGRAFPLEYPEQVRHYDDWEGAWKEGHAAALAKSEQLEALWREYVELLATELNLLVGLAVAHGWQGNQASYEKGVKLRAALGIEPVPSPAQKGEE